MQRALLRLTQANSSRLFAGCFLNFPLQKRFSRHCNRRPAPYFAQATIVQKEQVSALDTPFISSLTSPHK